MKIIYAIPGLGTTEEIFNNIQIPRHQIKVLKWPITQSGMSLKEYALLFRDQIDHSLPVNLLGVSFGGMLCVELAELMKTDKLILISSCKNRTEFPPFLKVLKILGLYRLFSDSLIRRFAKTFYRVLGFEESLKPAFFRMVDNMPKEYFRHSLQCLINWERVQNNIPMVHIQGTNDKVLQHQYIRSFLPIKNGSHAMIVNRASEINALLDPIFNEQ